MELQTLLNILYTNDLTDVVIRATQIDRGIEFPYKVGQTISVSMTAEKLLTIGLKPVTDKEHYYSHTDFYVNAEIIAIDPFKLKTPYFISLPTGENKWVSDYEFDHKLSAVVAIESPKTEE